MADTVRTLAALQALLPDNSAGDISAQDARDVLVSTFPPVFNVRAYGATGDGSTDDTAAVQAAIDACVAAGGGTVYFPAGVYKIAGSLQDTGEANAQLTLPAVAMTDQTVVIVLQGPTPPPYQFFTDIPVPDGSAHAVIKSTLTGGTGTASLLSGPYDNVPALGGNQNNVRCDLKNLVIQLPSNPTLTGVNLLYQQGCEVEDVLIHCGSVDLLSMTQPTHSATWGLVLPDYSHTAYTRVKGLNIFGCYHGIRLGELAVVSGLRIWSCYQGVVAPFAYHAFTLLDLGTYWTPYHLVAGGGAVDQIAELRVVVWSIENANGAGAGWQDSVYHVDDASNYLVGDAVYGTVDSYVGRNSNTFTKNGGSNFACSRLGTLVPTTAPTLASAEIGNVADDTVVLVFSENVKAPSFSTGLSVEVNASSATISSVTRQSTKTTLHAVLSGAVISSDTVTVSYAAVDGFIESAAGIDLASITDFAVTNNVAGGGGGTVIVLDNFTAADGTNLNGRTPSPTNTPGNNWAQGSGSWAAQSNRARAGTNGINILALDCETGDGTITVTVRRNATSSDQAVFFRGVDASNFWIADLRASDNTFKLFKCVSGSYTAPGGTDSVSKTFSANTDYVLQVILNGNSISATVDGGSALSVTDSFAATATVHGLWDSHGSGAQPDFDDFTVEA